jgi:O-succinylbenzoic acid--CoA ligase
VTTSQPRPIFLRPVPAGSVAAALESSLAGGDPLAPLPDSVPERQQLLTMLGTDQPVAEPDVAAVVGTSGSTGHPKGVVLSRAAMTASVQATQRRLGGPGDWALALPTHYVAGLMVVARCVIAGTTAHPASTDLADLPAVARRMQGRRHISVVPTQLARALTDRRLADALAGFDVVLLGGAAAAPQLLAVARDRGLNVVTSYGMSETCGGCVYDGVPLPGVGVDLEPESGRILLSGSTLFSGYRLRPELTAAALRGSTLLTQDRGRWEQGLLRLTGRLDDVVVSGGINVDLAEVERAAQDWPRLDGSEIVVIGVPDPDWGTAVVAVTDGNGSTDELRAHLRLSLPAVSVPRRLVNLAALPRTPSGKIDRQRLIADLTVAR